MGSQSCIAATVIAGHLSSRKYGKGGWTNLGQMTNLASQECESAATEGLQRVITQEEFRSWRDIACKGRGDEVHQHRSTEHQNRSKRQSPSRVSFEQIPASWCQRSRFRAQLRSEC